MLPRGAIFPRAHQAMTIWLCPFGGCWAGSPWSEVAPVRAGANSEEWWALVSAGVGGLEAPALASELMLPAKGDLGRQQSLHLQGGHSDSPGVLLEVTGQREGRESVNIEMPENVLRCPEVQGRLLFPGEPFPTDVPCSAASTAENAEKNRDPLNFQSSLSLA